MKISTGLFHVQNLTFNETSSEITCSFADFSNAHGCLVMVFCSGAVNNSELMELNALCDFRINKTGSKTASKQLPAVCFDKQACPALDIFAFDVNEAGTAKLTVAKCITDIPNINPYCSSCTGPDSDPSVMVSPPKASDSPSNEGRHKYIYLYHTFPFVYMCV